MLPLSTQRFNPPLNTPISAADDALSRIHAVAERCDCVLHIIQKDIDILAEESNYSDGVLPVKFQEAIEVYIQSKKVDLDAAISDDEIYDALMELNDCLSTGETKEKITQYLLNKSSARLLAQHACVPSTRMFLAAPIPDDLVNHANHYLTMTDIVLLGRTCRERYVACETYLKEELGKLTVSEQKEIEPNLFKSLKALATKLYASDLKEQARTGRVSEIPFIDHFNFDKSFARSAIFNNFERLCQVGPYTYQETIRKLKSGALDNIEAAVNYVSDEKTRLISADNPYKQALITLEKLITAKHPKASINYNELKAEWRKDGKRHNADLEVACICDGSLTQEHLDQITDFDSFHIVLHSPSIRKSLYRGEFKMELILNPTQVSTRIIHKYWVKELIGRRRLSIEKILHLNDLEGDILCTDVIRNRFLGGIVRFTVQQIFEVVKKNLVCFKLLSGRLCNLAFDYMTMEQMLWLKEIDLTLLDKYCMSKSLTIDKTLGASPEVKLALASSTVFMGVWSGKLTTEAIFEKTTPSGAIIINQYIGGIYPWCTDLKPVIDAGEIAIEQILSATEGDKIVLVEKGAKAFVQHMEGKVGCIIF